MKRGESGIQARSTPSVSPGRREVSEAVLRALEQQARRHYRRWRLDEAGRLARMVIGFDPSRSRPWFILGDIAMRRMNWQRAFEHFQQSVDRRRSHAMGCCRGGEALFRLGERVRARQWFDRAIADASDQRDAGARRARSFLRRHRAEWV